MIIKNGLVFTLKNGGSFEPLTIHTKEDVITLLESADSSSDAGSAGGEVVDASGCYIIPGLTDVHFHGCAGYDFCDGTPEAMEAISAYEFKNGITDICPATMTLDADVLTGICEAAAAFSEKQHTAGSAGQADLIGIHMEGPFVSPAKKGAQNGAYIKSPDVELLKKWQKASGGLVRLVTIAPEMPGAMNCIQELGKELAFSIGHTQADYNTARLAMEAGALHVTHLYNAMPPLTHRAPGVIGAAADMRECMVELICDGIHIDPAVVRATFKLFGEDNVILISDSMMATGQPDGTYALGGQPVHVCGSHATLADGTLAGSVTNLYACMVNAAGMGIPLAGAIKAATINPCRSIGMEHSLGSVAEGKKAHMLLLRTKDLSIQHIIKGQACI